MAGWSQDTRKNGLGGKKIFGRHAAVQYYSQHSCCIVQFVSGVTYSKTYLEWCGGVQPKPYC